MSNSSSNAACLSVVLATYNRAETLPDTLKHLAEQDLDPAAYEVIVVSDASPDNTRQVVQELAPRLPFHLAFSENQENRGPGHAQNVGIRMATAPVVVLMADDIFQSPGSLRAHLEFHRRRPEQEAAALGKVIQSPRLTQSVFLRHWDPFKFGRLEGAEVLPRYRFWACNISFKRRFMLEYGMFREDAEFTAGHEDTELGYRLAERGLRIHYLPEAWAHHYHVCTLDEAVERWHMRGLSYGRLRRLVKDPEITVLHHLLNRHTFGDYVHVLRGANSFRGRERSLTWHLFRECVRRVMLNRLTARLIWRPVLDRAEKWRWLAGLMNAQVYRAFLYYHFLRGARQGRKLGRD